MTLCGTDWSTTWRRINDAWPSLTTLVIYGTTWMPYLFPIVAEPVIFEHLNVLELGDVVPFTGVEFPTLRHASLSLYTSYHARVLARWQNIESLLLRNMDNQTSFDWEQFPKLQLLGLPTSHLWMLSRWPSTCPISRLAIYVHSRGQEPSLVESSVDRYAARMKINVDLDTITPYELDTIAHECATAGLELVGSPYHPLRRGVLFVSSMVPPHLTKELKSLVEAVMIVGFVCTVEVLKFCYAAPKRISAALLRDYRRLRR